MNKGGTWNSIWLNMGLRKPQAIQPTMKTSDDQSNKETKSNGSRQIDYQDRKDVLETTKAKPRSNITWRRNS
jgi:hypothetical protein